MAKLTKRNLNNNKRKKKKKEKSSAKINILLFVVLLQTFLLGYKNYDYILEISVPFANKYILNHSILSSNFKKADFEHDYTTMKAGLSNSPIIGDSLDADDDGKYDIENPVPIPKVIKVNILNGCRIAGLAGRWKSVLRKMDYDVRDVGNANERKKSLILSRINNMKPAYELAEKLGIDKDNVLLQVNPDLVDIDLTLILGRDYKTLNKNK